MKYEIIGKTVPVVEVKLDKGEKMYTQSGGMAYQSEGIEMTTNARGGIMKSLGRMFSGESIFMANYQAQRDDAMVGFAATVPGAVVPVDLSNVSGGMILQKGAFLCAEDSVNLDITLTKKLGAGFFGGEGFVLQKATGNGYLFLEVDGDVIEKELAAGEVLKVDTGNVAAFESTVSYEVETVKGLGNIFLGGEGLFLTKLVGPGKVILQSQNMKDFASRIIPYVPVRSSN